ncbi:type I polyketide synthase [Sphaerisporangium album]|uniref:type I polyketide synthase n=1 Tax=Sphaerisporangium album TaxID=509200 RepID=UPI001FE4A367|nr:type I polyketide synthase [Sphaerisporangium album]
MSTTANGFERGGPNGSGPGDVNSSRPGDGFRPGDVNGSRPGGANGSRPGGADDGAVAVIGLACRLPGAAGPEALWRLLRSGGHAIGEPPASRLRPEPGIAGHIGGHLDQVDGFDAAFFGVSPREAAAMDPQQRLVLELSWEVLEDAGILPGSLDGVAAGVFVGAIASDYAALVHRGGEEAITRHTLTGLNHAILANRVSYALGLRGPSLTVDTAQSSALVAVHLACESVRRGESAIAIAGGVHLNLVRESTLTAERFGGLSPDARSFTFDARANGYVRGEGAGLVLLKPLARAVEEGDTVYAVIRGSATNNDGATDGLTVPNPRAQEEVVRLALRRAGIEPGAVQYVEAHGTGTKVGDPIEARALGAALGAARPADRPLIVGSVKTNIGHLEGAAGIAGLLKTVLSLRHREIPASLNFETPNPAIDFDALNLRVATTPLPWPRPDAPLVAGVSAFGMGGTNCHVILTEASTTSPGEPANSTLVPSGTVPNGEVPNETVPSGTVPGGTVPNGTVPSGTVAGGEVPRSVRGIGGAEVARGEGGGAEGDGQGTAPLPFVVSGRDAAALREQAARLAETVAGETPLPDLAFSLSTARTAFEHRAVLVEADREGLEAALRALAAGAPVPSTVHGKITAGVGASEKETGASDPSRASGAKGANGTNSAASAGGADASSASGTRRTNAADTTDQAGGAHAGKAGGGSAGGGRRGGRTVFVFPGQGGQWVGMGRELARRSPVYAAHLRAVADALEPHVDWSPADVLGNRPGAASLDDVEVVQPALFAVMVALARLWETFGVRPDAVIGHSQGEIAAAHVAGALSLEDAAALVVLRSQAIAAISGRGGGMVSLPLPVERVRARLSRWEGRLGIGAVNGPSATVVSGDGDALEELTALYEAEDVPVRRVNIDYASHSPHVEAVRDRLMEVLPGYVTHPTEVAFYSTVTGGLLDTADLDVGYWYRNLRRPVEFDRAVRAALADGHDVFVESGPHPVLVVGLRQILDSAGAGRDAVVTETLRRDQGDLGRFLRSAARLHVQGVPVDWTPALPRDARRVPLPTYPFQRRPHWLNTAHGVPRAAAAPGRPERATTGERDAEGRDEAGEGAMLEVALAATAAVLGHAAPGAVGAERSFRDLGLDSLGAVELRDRLADATGLAVPATVTFDHPTPLAVARFLHAEASGRTADHGEPRTRATSGPYDEPVALVAMSGRWPGGADTPEELWDLVLSGADAITDFPANRGWDLDALYDPDSVRPGTSYTHTGGFLHDADRFDAEFFGIAPREAAVMDPQQRLLLESSWELLERAGIAPRSLHGTRTGVFVGAMPQEYGPRLHEMTEDAEGYALTGTATSVVSGRIAYTFGFQGPAVSVDTACSSSLVALHLAVRSLRAGESDLAIAGGVTVMSTPGMFTEFSRQRGLAPDGRCKPFAAAADGTAWAEGVGLLLVERLSDARRHGHPVLAVIRSTAVNQDGASNGLTAPNGPSQRRLIRDALAGAGLEPADVDVIEAHGTGTTLGDPIEAQAIIATYGQDRPADRPLLLGSVKSNIGHAQAAAGVAGMIKLVHALRHGVVPKTLHVDEPSPHVDWSAGAVRLVTETIPWPDTGRPRRAALSSFGISGTNAHVIIEQPSSGPGEEPPISAVSDPHGLRAVGASARVLPFVVSGRSAQGLRGQAGRLAAHLAAHPGLDAGDLAFSLATTRAALEHRAVVVGGPDDVRDGLRALAEGAPAPATVTGTAAEKPRVAFVFSGQGSQYAGMTRELYDTYPAYAAALDEITAHLDTHLDGHTEAPLIDVILNRRTEPGAVLAAAGGANPPPETGAGPNGRAADSAGNGPGDATLGGRTSGGNPPAEGVPGGNRPGGGLVDRTLYTQPALFAVQTALVRLLGAFGITPDIVTGHSVGAITAAHTAGILTLPDAARLIATRAIALDTLTRPGAMAALQAQPAEVEQAISAHELSGQVSLAALNAPASTVVSGDPDAIGTLTAHFAGQGRKTRRLTVSHAFHSHHLDPVLDDFQAAIADISATPPAITYVSDLTGTVLDEAPTAEYWARHLRNPVLFHQAVLTVQERTRATGDHTTHLEIGPDATLTPLIHQSLTSEDASAEITAVPVLRRGRPDATTLLTAVATVHTHAAPADWTPALPPAARAVDLPTYAFQRRRHWLDGRPPQSRPTAAGDDAVARFWDAVGHGDADALAKTLGTDDPSVRDSLGVVLPALAAWRAGRDTRAAIDAWRYRVTWRPLSATTAPQDRVPPAPGRWLVVMPDGTDPAADWARAIASALAERGGEAVPLVLDAASTDRHVIASVLTGLTSHERLTADEPGTPEIRPDGEGLAGVLSLLSLDDGAHPRHPAVPRGAAADVTLIQALDDAGIGAPLWIATRGAVSIGPSDPASGPGQALAWGLAGVVAAEKPERWGGVLDLPATPAARVAGLAVEAFTGAHRETELAVRASGTHARRLVPAPLGDAGARPPWRPRGTVLVTGGTGALGARLARRLARRGADHLLLVSRRGLDAPGAAALRDELTRLGSRVTVAACDVADGEALAAVLAAIPGEFPLASVFHTSAVLDDALVDSLTAERMDGVHRVKAGGAFALHELTRDLDLSAFVLFSSITGTMGTAGQGNYAPGNAVLDALADHRRSLGLPATSIAWGHWDGDGIAGPGAVRELRRGGLLPMDPELALTALEEALDHGETRLVVARVDWPAVAADRPLFSEIPEARTAPDVQEERGSDDAPALLSRLAGASEGERRQTVRRLVRAEVAAVLGHASAAAVDDQRGFRDQGFSSLSGVELRNRLSKATGIALPSTLVFDHPSPAALTDHLCAVLVPEPESPPSAVLPTAAPRTASGADLSTASDDELISFISDELGIS